MATSKRNVKRTKLFRIVQKCHEQDARFRPTIADCREIFRNINRNVFNEELKMPNFRLVYSGDFWGECRGDEFNTEKCTIKINKSFPSKRLFIVTLAHEMVHQWEWLVYEEMTHGKNFFVWRDELKKYNIPLNRAYSKKEYTVLDNGNNK